jgi:hypothetical protein
MGNETADAAEAVAPVSDRRAEGQSAEDAGQRPALPEADGAINAWPDASAESAMLSELRSRGETVTAAATEAVEEIETTKLPPLDQLVKQIPPDVREALDDLFRAKFVRVTRVPKKALRE